MSGVELRTIGGFRLRASGEDLTGGMGARHQALLVYLVYEGRPVDVSELCSLVGRGGEGEAEAAGLQRAIAWLTEHVPALEVELSRDSVSISSPVWWDVRELDDAIDRRALKSVARLYQGDFLEGFSCGSEAFDAWAAEQRRRLREYWEGAVRSRALESEGAERWAEAADWWRVLMDRNPQAADLVTRTMRAYGRARQRGEAARVYEAYLDRVAGQGGDEDPAVERTAGELSIPRPTGAKNAGETASRQVIEPRVRASGGPRPTVIQPRSRPSAGPEQDDEPLIAVRDVSFGPPTSRASTRPDSLHDLTREDPGEGPVSVIRPINTRIQRVDKSEVFTDSIVIHIVKTFWAKLTTPRAVRAYQDVLESCAQASVLLARAFAELSVLTGRIFLRYGSQAAVATGTGARRAGKQVGRGVQRVGQGVSRGVQSVGQGVGRVGEGIGRGAERVSQEVGRVGEGIECAREATARRAGAVGTVGGLAGRQVGYGLGRVLGLALGNLRALPGVFLSLLRSVGRGLVSVFKSGTSARFALRPAGAVQTSRTRGRHLAVRLGSGLARQRVALVVALAAVAVVLGAPIVADVIPWPGAGRDEAGPKERDSELREMTVQRSAVRATSLPRVSLPTITVPRITIPKPELKTPSLPDINVSVPTLVREPVEKLGEMFAGPLLERGERLVIADINDGGAGDGPGLGQLAALTLEAELAGFGRFSVLPRERALLTLAAGRTGLGLRGSEALELARAANASVIITGRFEEGEDGGLSRIRLAVLDVATGAQLHALDVDITGGDWIEAIGNAARRLSQRFGEAPEWDGGDAPAPVLTTSLPALGAYTRARAELFGGRYSAAARSSREAVRHDSSFAAANQLLAQAEALLGDRRQARSALEAAYRHRHRLNGRERLRVIADREALRGRDSDAIIAYDYLFQSYRDDVIALKSLALLQRRIGAPGGGMGNLQVAYEIDPVDWPPLARIARYIDYRGTLPRLQVAEAGGASVGPGSD